jgi:hypothetical protein
MCDFVRDSSHFIDEILQFLRRKNLIKKDDYVQGDEKYCDEWKAIGRVLVLKGNEHLLSWINHEAFYKNNFG